MQVDGVRHMERYFGKIGRADHGLNPTCRASKHDGGGDGVHDDIPSIWHIFVSEQEMEPVDDQTPEQGRCGSHHRFIPLG